MTQYIFYFLKIDMNYNHYFDVNMKKLKFTIIRMQKKN